MGSDSIDTDANTSTIPKIREIDWRLMISRAFSLVAIGFLGAELVLVAFMYQYAWQKGLYPKPGAPSNPSYGPWTHDSALCEGFRLILNPPVYAFLFTVLSLLAKPTNRGAIILFLSFIFFIATVSNISLISD